MKRLDRAFYTSRNALELAEALLGKTLVRYSDGVRMSGIITETEAYMGAEDRASHAYGNRKTERNSTMYLKGGHAYVYLTYGMYNLLNITSGSEGVAEAVLLRGIYPISGEEKMLSLIKQSGRRKNLPESMSSLGTREKYSLTNGPGKLCRALGIDRGLDKYDLASDGEFFVQDDGIIPEKIVRSKRIGIDYAGEAADYLWRFSFDPHDALSGERPVP